MRVNNKTNFQLAMKDLVEGLSSIHLWPVLGWQEVAKRYRRSVLGPFWLTLSTGIMIGVMGPLYGKLFNQDIGSYFAHLTVSFVLWQFIAQCINESCNAFIAAEGYIKQVKLPLSVHMLAVVWKNLIVLLHNAIVIVLIMAYYRPPLGISLLLVPIALALLAANAFIFGMICGMVSARFRDIPLIITNLVQVVFFLTPVMWQPQMLGRHQWTVNLNPFYHLLEIVRAPLLGVPTNPWSWPAVAAITLAGTMVMIALFSRFRARIAYWV
jgi:ABC-type polysaccharide/polyol phosphate export permease